MFNKKNTKIIGLVLLILIAFMQWGCKKENPVSADTTPIVKEAPIGFAVTQDMSYIYSPATPTGPDFANGATFYFSATFNAEVTWKITISDSTSGAVKTLSGTSSVLNQSNASWDGSHDGLYYFNVGDNIKATLTILGSNVKSTLGPFSVTSFNPFPGYTGYIMGELGFIVAQTYGVFNFGTPNGMNSLFPRMKANSRYASWPYYVSNDQGAYGDTPPDPFFGGIALSAQRSSSDNDSVPSHLGYKPPIGFAPIEGSGAYMLYGTDFNFDYFVSGIKAQTTWCHQAGPPIPQLNVFDAQGVTGGLPANTFPSPDSLYFNVWVYGTGDVISYFHWNIEEDDNNDHVHYDTYEDCYYYVITTSHTGWKLFSVPYSAMLTDQSPKNGGKGNHIQQTKNITAVGMQALSSPPGQTCKVIIDYPTITYGKPYNPNQ